MSLAIDVDRVYQVLLIDGWHMVEDNSFEIDAYEYTRNVEAAKEEEAPFRRPMSLRLGGGEESLIPSRGARWVEVNGPERFNLYCPLNSILAVRERCLVRKAKSA